MRFSYNLTADFAIGHLPSFSHITQAEDGSQEMAFPWDGNGAHDQHVPESNASIQTERRVRELNVQEKNPHPSPSTTSSRSHSQPHSGSSSPSSELPKPVDQSTSVQEPPQHTKRQRKAGSQGRQRSLDQPQLSSTPAHPHPAPRTSPQMPPSSSRASPTRIR